VKTYSFYDLQTGIFSPKQLTVSTLEAAMLNVPPGHTLIEGEHDHLSSRVVAGEVVDWQPPAPDADHEWNADRRRWVKRPEVVAAELADQSARAQIDAAEKSQLRAIRELMLNPSDAAARTRLQQIDQTIAAARPQIRRSPNG
jgi:hypothetical protein